jgi:hypothetical protein
MGRTLDGTSRLPGGMIVPPGRPHLLNLVPPGRRHLRRSGLTRTETVLLVLFFAGALALLIPYVYRQRLMQRRTLCEKRQLDTAQAILAFESLHARFPGYCNALSVAEEDGQVIPADGTRSVPATLTGWVLPILEHLGRDSKSLVPEIVCPDNPPPDPPNNATWMAWVVNSGLPDVPNELGLPPDWPANGVFLDRCTKPLLPEAETSLAYVNAHDGAENTFLLSENIDAGRTTDTAEAKVAFVWTPGMVAGEPSPNGVVLRINKKRGEGNGAMLFARPSSNHRQGVNVVFCDTSTRFLSEGIDYFVYCRLMTPDDAGLKLAGSQDPIPPPYARRDGNK